MFNFVVVLPMLLAAASAGLIAPAAGPLGYSAYGSPLGINTIGSPALALGARLAVPQQLAYSAQLAVPQQLAYSAQLAVPQQIVKSVVAAPALSYAAAPALAYSQVAVAQPIVRTVAVAASVAVPITKTVHYENKPVVTGYSSQILKPAFPGGAGLATPAQLVTKQAVVAPARSVQTIIPQVTRVEPEVEVRRVAVDVPVQRPYPVEQVVRTVAAPAIIPAPAVQLRAIAAPAVQVRTIAAPAQIAYGASAQLAYAAPAQIASAQLAYAAPANLAYATNANLAYASNANLAYATNANLGYSSQLVKTIGSPLAYGAAPALANAW